MTETIAVAADHGGYELKTVLLPELNALGLMPWKTTANKGLNMLYDGPGVRNPLVAAFGLWVVFLILTEIFLRV